MQYKPKYNFKGKVIIFDLNKPIYGSAYSIYQGHLTGKEDWKIVINTPEGTATYKNFNDYKRKAEKIEMVYNYPDRPMIMWKRMIYPDIKERKVRKKIQKRIIEDVSMPISVWEKLRPHAKQLGLI